MAVTDIHPISVTLNLAIDYILNPEKTNGGKLVSCIGCTADGKKAAQDFFYIRELGTGRGSTLAQHMYQSFKPGEVTPEQAHELGVQLAEEFLGGEYQYIIATHVDKNHIHNHIIFNNIGYNHFRSFEYKNNRGKNVFEKLQKVNDKICRENNLSVIENPELGKGKSYYEWMMNKEGQSWKTKLKLAIDNVIMESKNFDDFLTKCKDFGVLVEYNPQHKIALKFMLTEQRKNNPKAKFTRARTLGWWYEESQIRRRIEQYQQIKLGYSFSNKKSRFIDTSTDKFQQEKYLKRWADIQNMKEASRLLNFLSENGFSSQEELEDISISKYGERVQLVAELNNLQKQIDESSHTIKLIQTYLKYKPYNDEYRRSSNRKKYEKENAAALKKYNSVKEQLEKDFPNKRLPNIEQLYDDRAELISQRNEKNMQYKKTVSELRELDKARSEIQNYLNAELKERNERKSK